MDVTPMTWIVAIGGLALIALLGGVELVALVRPRSEWTIANIYGGSPTQPTQRLTLPSTRVWHGQTRCFGLPFR